MPHQQTRRIRPQKRVQLARHAFRALLPAVLTWEWRRRARCSRLRLPRRERQDIPYIARAHCRVHVTRCGRPSAFSRSTRCRRTTLRFVARHKDEGRRVVLVTVRLIFLYVLTRVAALLPRSSVMCESLLTACAIWTTFPRGPVARHPLNTFSRKDMR